VCQPDQVENGGTRHDFQPNILLSALQIGVDQAADARGVDERDGAEINAEPCELRGVHALDGIDQLATAAHIQLAGATNRGGVAGFVVRVDAELQRRRLSVVPVIPSAQSRAGRPGIAPASQTGIACGTCLKDRPPSPSGHICWQTDQARRASFRGFPLPRGDKHGGHGTPTCGLRSTPCRRRRQRSCRCPARSQGCEQGFGACGIVGSRFEADQGYQRELRLGSSVDEVVDRRKQAQEVVDQRGVELGA
jgi:hypothetical protein